MYHRKLALFGSHGGSNIEAILDKIGKGDLNTSPEVIISNNRNSNVLKIAEKNNIPGYWIPGKDNEEEMILDTLRKHDVNLILLAGYMKKLGEKVLSEYNALNIHPSLLPKYGGKGMYGMKVHEAVIDAEEKESGATIHLADNEYDRGRILAQYKVPVFDKDSPESLAERVKGVEHVLYPQTLKDMQEGLIDIKR